MSNCVDHQLPEVSSQKGLVDVEGVIRPLKSGLCEGWLNTDSVRNAFQRLPGIQMKIYETFIEPPPCDLEDKKGTKGLSSEEARVFRSGHR